MGSATPDDFKNLDLLIVGSPTQGGRATQALQKLMTELPSLKNVKVAAFDTRLREKDLNFALKLLVKTIGYAAPKIAEILEDKGGELIVPPEGFFVTGKEGPLVSGELDRARVWISKILS